MKDITNSSQERSYERKNKTFQLPKGTKCALHKRLVKLSLKLYSSEDDRMQISGLTEINWRERTAL